MRWRARRSAKSIDPASGRLPLGRRIVGAATICAVIGAGLSCGGASDATKPANLPSLSLLRLLDDSVMFAVGDSLDVPYTATRSDGITAGVTDVRWNTRNPAVVRFVEPGRLVGTGGGRTWAVASNDSLADSMVVVVRTPVTVRLSSHLDSLTSLGDTLSLSATFPDAPAAHVSLTWGSRDSTVVRVTQAGLAIATSEGTAYVVAREDSGGSDSDRVVVRQRLQAIDVAPLVDTIPRERTVRLSAQPVDARGATIARLQPVTWHSAAPAIAVVDDTGLVTGEAVGVDTLSASVTGMTRLVPLVVGPLVPLRFSRDTIYVGVGQYPSAYAPPLPLIIADSFATDHAVPITFTVADSTIAVEGKPVSLGTYGPDSLSAVLPVGRREGSTVMTASGPNYSPATVVIRVTKPRLAMIDTVFPQFDPTQPTATATMFADFQDSLGHYGQLVVPVTVHYRSSDSAVVVPSAPDVVVDSGQINVNVRMRPVGPGTAWLVSVPDGGVPDSSVVRVSMYEPRLQFVREPGSSDIARDSPMYLGAGESTTYEQVGVYATSTTGAWGWTQPPVTLSHGRRGVIQIPDSAALNSGYFHVVGLAQGRDTIVATAAGYAPDSLIVIVTRPSFRFYFGQTTYATMANAATFPTTTVFHEVTMEAIYTDSVGLEQRGPPAGEWYVARLTSTDTSVLRPERDSIIFTGGSSDGQDIRTVAVAPGTARLVLSDPAGRGIPDTSIAITVVPAPVHLRYVGAEGAVGTVTVGFEQTLLADEHVYVDGPSDFQYAAPVTLHSTNDAVVRPSATTVQGLDFGYDDGHFDLTGGTEAGTAWIVASGPGIIPDSLPVTVGRPQLELVREPTQDTTGIGVALRLTDQAGLVRRTVDSLTFDLLSTNWSVLRVDSATLGVPPMATMSPGYTTVDFAGAGTAAVQVRDARTVPYAYEPAATRLIQVDAFHHPLTEILPESLPARGPPR